VISLQRNLLMISGKLMRRLFRLAIASVALLSIVSCDDSENITANSNHAKNLSTAEAFIDAFYSFDRSRLESFLSFAEESIPSIAYYQGWAEGGNYEIVNRRPCAEKKSNVIRCAITVEDDPMLALGIDFKVTDTFEISFENGEIRSVETSSDDMQVYYDAAEWVRKEFPELVEEPCQGFFDGGPTPGDCARAMAEGYRKFSASDDFPE
jgi:hypothetical protein